MSFWPQEKGLVEAWGHFEHLTCCFIKGVRYFSGFVRPAVAEASGARLNEHSNYKPTCLATDAERMGSKSGRSTAFCVPLVLATRAMIVLLGNGHKETGGVHLIPVGGSQSVPRRALALLIYLFYCFISTSLHTATLIPLSY